MAEKTKILSVSPTGEQWTVECPFLRLTLPDGGTRTVSLSRESTVIGSSPEADVPLKDDYVSGRHCRIRQADGAYAIEDLGSTNGTFIRGGKIQESPLTPGTEIRIGQTIIEFNAERKEEAIAPTRASEFRGIIGASPAMQRLFTLLARVAPTDHTVLVRGPTGSGKELIARALHDLSQRAQGPYIILNCGAISESLIESELFGHERGAFTGAANRRLGAFEEAEGGTLFLDEIGELPLELQPKLLRVLENRTVRRVGSNTEAPVNVRIVAATHRNLADLVKEGKFREDLYFRLQVIPIPVPPLAERREDIPLLAAHFLRQAADGGKTLSPRAMDKLSSHDWPGNIRELKNVIARSAVFAEGAVIGEGDVEFLQELAPGAASAQSLEGMERIRIEEVLKQTEGNKTRAAEILGIAKSTLFKKLKDYGIPL